ncbi:MAG: tetratricopeptide repeat protein [Verrucomicrobiota bacterium]|nr:tetratricopeptide repeat protein [Verrucomicrobiota bacterium]
MTADLPAEKPSDARLAADRAPIPGKQGLGKLQGGLSPGLCLFLGVFALRLLVLARLSESHFLLPNAGDMRFYNDWALRILHGQWTDHQAFYGLPLYPYFLALLYKVFGYSPFVPGLIQAAADAGTAVILYQLAVLVFGDLTTQRSAPSPDRGWAWFAHHPAQLNGILAALGWAFFKPEQAYAAILMPTALAIFVFWFVVWQIVKRRRVPALWVPLLLGLLMGFSAMGIATILLLIPLVLAALFLRWAGPFPQRIVGVGLLLAGVFLGAAPAWVHNGFIARDPVFLSAHGGLNLWIGNNPVATGYPEFPPGLHAGQEALLKDSISAAENALGRPLKRSEVSAYWSQQAKEWIRDHPAAWIRLLGLKVQKFWNAFSYDDISVVTALRDQSIIFPGIGFGIVAALGLPGLVVACWRIPGSRWIAAAVLLHMASLLPVFVTERYRDAAVPGLLLFASFGLCELGRNIATRHYLPAGLFLFLLFGSTAFVSMPQRDPTLWALDTYNSGLQALEARQLPLARQKIELAYAYSPQNAEINFAQGNLHLALGEADLARSFYHSALQLDPRHAGAYNNLGVMALRERRWELAATFLAKAHAANPRDAKIYFLLAQSHFHTGDLDSARVEIKRALELDPDRPEFHSLQQELERR